MIQLLFTLLSFEGVLILLLIVRSPFRKLAILGLDRVKRGRGPIMVKTIAATVFVVMVSSVYSIAKIQKRSFDAGMVTPTDQVLLSRNLLEASLMGYSLFLSLLIDRLHHYIRELRVMRKSVEAAKKHNGGFEDKKGVALDEEKSAEVSGLKQKITQLESMLVSKEKEAKIAEATAEALKKQSEDLLLEYDRMHEENQSLHSQQFSADRKLSRSDSRKNI